MNKSNIELNTDTYINKSSIKNLVITNVNSLSFIDLLRGQNSLGGYLESAGLSAVPSPNNTSPENNPYFSGGYCTEMYGSVYGGAIDGIQMEHNRIGIRDSDSNVRTYAKTLAGILLEFLKYHYNLDFITDVDENEPLVSGYQLFQNYPNPFNPTTTISYTIPYVETQHAASLHYVTLKIYDVIGKEISTLVNEQKSSGKYTVLFDATSLPSGLYFYQLIADRFQQTKKMLLIK